MYHSKFVQKYRGKNVCGAYRSESEGQDFTESESECEETSLESQPDDTIDHRISCFETGLSTRLNRERE
jgi:hypothetical protein